LRALFAALLLGAACGAAAPLPFEPAGPSAAPDPSRPGPFAVGVRTLALSDPARPGPDGAPRLLTTEVWYPAAESARGGPGVAYDVTPLLTEDQRRQVAGRTIPLLQTSAVRDAPPRRDRGPYPLVLFSHGQGGIRWQSAFYTVTLASHGHVVAAPDHPGTTLWDALRRQLTGQIENQNNRPDDLTFLIDRLTSMPPGDPLAGLADRARIGATGHSFGAFTILRTAARDGRIGALVAQAPPDVQIAWLELPASFRLRIPVQLQGARLDRTLPYAENVVPTWERLDRPRYLLELRRGGHFSFADICALDLASLAGLLDFADLSEILDDGCGPDATPPAVAQSLLNHFAVGFFNAFLRGSATTRAALVQARAEALGAGEAVITSEP
jgi:predicted dienelactone hydrolase